MKKSMKKIVALLMAVTMVTSTFSTTFAYTRVEDGKITDSAVVNNYGEGGHEAACMLMDDYNVAVLICDSIGQSAIDGLQEISVSVIPSIEGKCDDAVEDFLSGKLVAQIQGATCSACGGHDEGGCCDPSSGCGAGCGGCCG